MSVEAKIYDFLQNNETGIFKDKKLNKIIGYVHINHWDIQKFIGIVGNSWFAEGGCDVRLFEHTIAINLNDILEGFGQSLEDYKDCFNEDDWNTAYGAKTCCCCLKTCYTEDGAYPAVVFSGVNYEDPRENGEEDFICEECSINYEEYGDGFVKRFNCSHCGAKIHSMSAKHVEGKDGAVCEDCAELLKPKDFVSWAKEKNKFQCF